MEGSGVAEFLTEQGPLGEDRVFGLVGFSCVGSAGLVESHAEISSEASSGGSRSSRQGLASGYFC